MCGAMAVFTDFDVPLAAACMASAARCSGYRSPITPVKSISASKLMALM